MNREGFKIGCITNGTLDKSNEFATQRLIKQYQSPFINIIIGRAA